MFPKKFDECLTRIVLRRGQQVKHFALQHTSEPMRTFDRYVLLCWVITFALMLDEVGFVLDVSMFAIEHPIHHIKQESPP